MNATAHFSPKGSAKAKSAMTRVESFPVSEDLETGQSEVVLVEDDEFIRQAFSDLLVSEGYRVRAFSNGLEALKGLANHKPPCLILLDWMMPVMDGEHFLASRIKCGKLIMETPVVVVSAMTSWIRKRPGISEMLSKPVDVDNLLQVVRDHCRPSAEASSSHDNLAS